MIFIQTLIIIAILLLPFAILYRVIHEYNSYKRRKSPPLHFIWIGDNYVPETIYYTPQRILDYVEKENNKQLIGNSPFRKD